MPKVPKPAHKPSRAASRCSYTMHFPPKGPTVTLFRPTFRLQVVQDVSFMIEVKESRLPKVLNFGWDIPMADVPKFFVADTIELVAIHRTGQGLDGTKLNNPLRFDAGFHYNLRTLKHRLRTQIKRALESLPVKLSKEQISGTVEHLETSFLTAYEPSKVNGLDSKSWGSTSMWVFTVRPQLQR